jgi:8-oxo-dGTP pyrophosphatase MutT (NUDIX family)
VAADELVEHVDEAGNVLAVVTRAEMRASRLRHRTVCLIVVHAGRLLVHRRADHKDIWPGYWDIAAGGVVGAGESWDDAARRELLEELGIDAVPTFVGDGSWEADDAAVVTHIYIVEHAGPFHFDDGEVVAARFVTRTELDQLLATDRFCPDSLELALPYALRHVE